MTFRKSSYVPKVMIFSGAVALAMNAWMITDSSAAPEKKKDAGAAASSYEAEKAKAMANPYANDLGPDKIDVSSYPKQYQAGYAALQVKCAKCHTPARPLNSQFVELPGKDLNERKVKTDALKKSDPGLFKDKNVWQVEGDVWQRYVKRMMAKPGCEITKDEGKKIWEFLAYDSNQRKVGAKKSDWEKHRKGLLDQFKAKHPARYKELYETSSASSK